MKIRQVARYASDLDAAERFWSTLLDRPSVARFDPTGLLFFDIGGMRLLLERDAAPALIYVEVDSIADALARLGDAVEVVSADHVIFEHEDDALGPVGTAEHQAFVADPDGNPVGLIEFVRR